MIHMDESTKLSAEVIALIKLEGFDQLRQYFKHTASSLVAFEDLDGKISEAATRLASHEFNPEATALDHLQQQNNKGTYAPKTAGETRDHDKPF